MGTETVLRMKDVVFRFWKDGKRNILDHVCLDIEAGGITVIMGGSGCGKSTLAAVAAGLYPENGGYLESGTIELFGRPLSSMDPAKRAELLTVMFQNPDLQFCMDTLRRELRFCLENLCVDPAEMDSRLETAAKRLGVEDLLDRSLSTLSGGEKQKAALCCLYCMESRCLILDEPFANIDPDSAKELASMLARLRDEGRTVIVIDHRLDAWLDVLDEVIVLGEGGSVLRRGITAENLADAQPLFREQGLFYPERTVRRETAQSGSVPAITLRDVGVPKGTPKKRQPAEYLLRGVNASFPKGRMSAVLGSSGCGKTTTFLSILKQHPYTGTILLGDTDIARVKPKELYKHIGIVFQNPANQFISQNVEEEVRGSLRVWDRALSEEDCTGKTDALLEDYGLSRFRRFSPYMLSQGQQRRLAVLSVLCGKQEILFLDEPTYGQDQRSTTAIMRQLRRKVDEEGLTVIFITHDRALCAAWADHVWRMENGTLREVTGNAEA